MSLLPYWILERGVWSLLNALDAPTVATIYATIEGNTVTDDTQLTNPLFNKFSTHLEIMNAQEILASAICKTEGQPRRVDFIGSVVQLTHGSALPTKAGTIGAVYDASGNPLDAVSVDRIGQLIASQGSSLWVAGCEYYAVDGTRFYTTLVSPAAARVEFYDYTNPFSSFANLDSNFSVTSPVSSLLHSEFRPAWQYLAAGLLASKLGTYRSEANDYLALAERFAMQQGVSIPRIVVDYQGAAAR